MIQRFAFFSAYYIFKTGLNHLLKKRIACCNFSTTFFLNKLTLSLCTSCLLVLIRIVSVEKVLAHFCLQQLFSFNFSFNTFFLDENTVYLIVFLQQFVSCWISSQCVLPQHEPWVWRAHYLDFPVFSLQFSIVVQF